MRRAEARRRVRNELRKIKDALKNHNLVIEIQWLFDDRSLYGDCESDHGVNGHIRIDPFKEMIGTLVHEVGHHLHDRNGMTHREIRAIERLVMRHATPRELFELFGFLALRWRMTMTDMYRGRKMPSCLLCGRTVPRVPGGDGSLDPVRMREALELDT